MGQTHRFHYPVFEILHEASPTLSHADHRISQADLAGKAVRAVTGTRAFREYSWLKDVAATNSSGNLRGMVLSAKWRTAFRYTGHLGEHLENLGVLAGFVASIAEAAPRLDSIASSSESLALKGMRTAAVAGTAAERALLGIVPAGAHAIYRSLEGWCMIAGLAGGKMESGAAQCIDTLKLADSMVQSTFKTVTSTENQSKAIWLVIDVAHTIRPTPAVTQGVDERRSLPSFTQ